MLVSTLSLCTSAQVRMMPIDSLYLNGIAAFYETAGKVSHDIWPGMELSPVCIYRVGGPAILYNHPDPPASFVKVAERTFLGTQAELQLMGSTITEINGVLTAIADYGYDTYSHSDQFFAVLFHEMHHAYQRNLTIAHDNPALLLVYPENPANDAIKLMEQNLLYEMVFASDELHFRKLLNEWYGCRLKREEIIGPVFFKYEKTVENLEGPAFYCEYRFFNDHGSAGGALKMNYNHKHFWSSLNTPYYGRSSLRLRHLVSGMALCKILNKYHQGWQEEYYSGDADLFDYFVSKLKAEPASLPDFDQYQALSWHHTPKLAAERQMIYESFNDQPGLRVVLRFESIPQFRGFDPMNAVAITDTIILHKTFLNLAREDSRLFVANQDVVTTVQDQVWFVKKAVFFVDSRDEVQFRDGKVHISVPGVHLTWSGEVVSDQGGEVVVLCR